VKEVVLMNYNNVKFKGNFRSYQQRILDSADLYLTDGKINIVAAPGSGKTILGLELIRRLGKPCIILSPTTTIRDQWGERFKESFSAHLVASPSLNVLTSSSVEISKGIPSETEECSRKDSFSVQLVRESDATTAIPKKRDNFFIIQAD